jgi:hypothetical protein
MSISLRFLFIAAVAIALLSGCVTADRRGAEARPADENGPVAEPSSTDGATGVQNRLVEAANWAKGRNDLSNNGRKFSMDCSGVVSAIYWQAGIDLQAAYPRYTGNGVTRIYRYLEEKKLLYRPDEPVPGDIIFWDNSYDKNSNGMADDELTHVGMVVSVGPQGDVVYVHHDYLSGVIFAGMYPPDPSNRIRNSMIRMKSLGPTSDGKSTSGDLYRKAGRGWELES